jgi:hypothetical protein
MAEPTLRDILDALLRLNSKFDHWESRINYRLNILENASLQAPAPAPVDEAPSDEPADEPSDDESCDESYDDDYSQIDEPCDELYNEPCKDASSCQIEPPCKSAYEPFRHRVKLSIRHQKPSNRTQLELPSFKSPPADDVVDTPCGSIIQGVIAVDGVSLACWHRDVFTCVDRWKHRAGKQHGDSMLGRLNPTGSGLYGVLHCFLMLGDRLGRSFDVPLI